MVTIFTLGKSNFSFHAASLTVCILLTGLFLTGCVTQGQLDYYKNGQLLSTCDTEYSGSPSVDQYAVEYTLSYCARKVPEKGYDVVDKSLLELDLSIPNPPQGREWTFELATQMHNNDELTDKEYGYIIAFVDLFERKAAP